MGGAVSFNMASGPSLSQILGILRAKPMKGTWYVQAED